MSKSNQEAGPRVFRIASLFFCLCVSASLSAQSLNPVDPASAAGGADGATALPSEFRTIKLGMGIEEVQAILQKDPLFDYRGPEDVSLLPTKNQSLIEASGPSFIKRGFFQFVDGKLWVIILFLNPDKIDHYTIFSSLVAKYGEPILLDPKEARWEDGSVRMALERPLTLRYMDIASFNKMRNEGQAKAGIEEIGRQDFLGGL